MKKFLTVIVLAMVLCVCTLGHAQNAPSKGFYMGVGASYVVENLNVDPDTERWLRPVDVNFDNTRGMRLKAGTHCDEYVSLELVFDTLSFETNESETLVVYGWYGFPSYLRLGVEGELDVWTLMLAAKVAKPGKVSPFLVTGVGVMQADLSITLSAIFDGWSLFEFSESDSDMEPCVKIGAGVDFFLDPSFSIGVEWNYVIGVGEFSFDLDMPRRTEIYIEYHTWTLGVAYHF